jgi:sulfoxide reductase heme-binding subunit YedZ
MNSAQEGSGAKRMMNGVGRMRSWRGIANVALAVLLALPLGLMLQGPQQEDWVLADALPPSGEAAALIMFAAMAIGPLARLAGGRSEAVRWLMRRRRNIGVVAFCYAALHLGIYVVDMGTLDLMLAEIDAPGIWTGWLALALMALPAAASNDRAMRFLRGWWKPVQRLVYPVVALTLVHWAILMYGWREPLVHVAPMLALYAAAMIRPMFARKRTHR